MRRDRIGNINIDARQLVQSSVFTSERILHTCQRMIHLAVISAGSGCAGIDLVLSPTMGQNITMGKIEDEVGGMIWDLPLRLFHWLLAVAVIVSIGSVKNENMFVHEKSGLTILGLLGFRLVWGVIGSHHARFVHFVKSPGEVIAYIKGQFAETETISRGMRRAAVMPP